MGQTDNHSLQTDTVTSKGDYGYLEPVLHKTVSGEWQAADDEKKASLVDNAGATCAGAVGDGWESVVRLVAA